MLLSLALNFQFNELHLLFYLEIAIRSLMNGWINIDLVINLRPIKTNLNSANDESNPNTYVMVDMNWLTSELNPLGKITFSRKAKEQRSIFHCFNLRGKKRKISKVEKSILEDYFKKDPNWSRETVKVLKSLVNLPIDKIYKWGYDKKKLITKRSNPNFVDRRSKEFRDFKELLKTNLNDTGSQCQGSSLVQNPWEINIDLFEGCKIEFGLSFNETKDLQMEYKFNI